MGNKKQIFLFATALLLLVFAQNVKAEIISDCSLTAITTPGYYELNQSISSANTCLTISASDIEIDCKGNTVTYANTGTATRFGIDVVLGTTSLENITIRNCILVKPSNLNTAGYGIRMQRTSNSYIVNNTILTNGTTNNYGIYILTGSDYNVIENNTVSATGTSTGNIGIHITSDSDYNNVTGNTVQTYGTTTGYAVYLAIDSGDNLVKDNNLSTVSVTTTASNGHTVYVFSSKRNDIFNNYISTSGVGTNYAVYLNANANSNAVVNNTVSSSGTATTNFGIYALNSRLNIIENNTVSTSGTTTNHGIGLSGDYLTNVSNNNIRATGSSTGNFGIYIIDSFAMDIENNNISTLGTTTGYGISLTTSTENDIRNNIIYTNGSGATNTGILLTTSTYNVIDNNTITTWGTSANAGIFLTTTSNENIISNNTLLARGTTTTNYGIYATQSQFNEILNNNITTNGGTTTNYGIHFITNANRNIVTDNVISTYGTTSNHGIFLSTASYNIFTGNNITANGSTTGVASTNYGIHLTVNSNENEFYNGTISTGAGGSNYGVYLLTDTDRNIIQGHTISTGGDFSLNHGVFLSSGARNTIEDNIISTHGTTTNFGIHLLASANRNTIKNNNISTSGSTPSTSYAFYLRATAPNYPTGNNITSNNLVSIEGADLYFYDAAINENNLINQIIEDYTFRVAGGDQFNIKSDFGEINFLEQLVTSGSGLSDKVYVTENLASIDESTAGLNKSAEIVLYNLPTTSAELQIYRNGILCGGICQNLTSMQAGNVTFNVTRGGNYSILAATSIPTIQLNLPENDSSINQNNINFNFTVTDDSAGDLNCNIYIDSALNQTNSSTQNDTLTNFAVDDLAEGSHQWYVVCFDSAGNMETSETRNFSIAISQPSVLFNYPEDGLYVDDINSIILNYTAIDNDLRSMTVWLYGDDVLLDVNYEVENGTELVYEWNDLGLGEHNWTVVTNNGIKNSSEAAREFYIIDLTINCEAGGPYQSGGLVLVHGNITNGTSSLSGQIVNVSVYKEGVLNASKALTSLADGSFQTTFSNLASGSYTLNASSSYNGINKTCGDSLFIGGAASLILNKIVSFHNVTNETIFYNISLSLTNKGTSNSDNSNISDSDSPDSPYSLETIGAGETIVRSYVKSYSRNSTTYFIELSSAASYGMDAYSNSLVSSSSTMINTTIPSADAGEQITLIKNAYFNSENSTTVNYTLSVEVVNSGGSDLTGITVLDSDLDLSEAVNLNRTQSYSYSGENIVSKAASNTEKTFVKATATYNSTTYFSNQIKLGVAGYGGPADAAVYAPESTTSSTSFNSIITVINQNPDIGQDFIVDYWITSDVESTNYTSGQQTVYVSAMGETNLTATLTAPSVAGNYRYKTIVSWAGGTATAYDSFVVTQSPAVESEEDSDNTNQGSSSYSSKSSTSITGKVVDEVVCNRPYIRYGKECCLDQDYNNICDSDDREIEAEFSPDFQENVPEGHESENSEEILMRINKALLVIASLFSSIQAFSIFKEGSSNKSILMIGAVFLVLVILAYLITGLVRRKPREINRLKGTRGIRVYSSDGHKIGRVKEVYIEDNANKVYGWLIELDKDFARKVGEKKILMRQKHVKSVRNIMILDMTLENFEGCANRKAGEKATVY